jgi:putative NADPH-quinone reductase
MNFDAILRDGYRRLQPLEPDLVTAHETLLACDHMVPIFPLWCGDMPAVLKGFIERVLRWRRQAQTVAARGRSARVPGAIISDLLALEG